MSGYMRRQPRTVITDVLTECRECGRETDEGGGRRAAERAQQWARRHADDTGHEPSVSITRLARYGVAS